MTDDEKELAFVGMPDGCVYRLKKRRWKFGDKMIALGTVIVVSREIRPFQRDEFLISTSKIASQVAPSAASIAVVARDQSEIRENSDNL